MNDRNHNYVAIVAEHDTLGPSLFTARLRHARHYVEVAAEAELRYRQGGIGQLDGLARFDQERAQIDAAWLWARTQPPSEDVDVLLSSFAYATVEIGDLRYGKRDERIPQLEAALAAARRWEATELAAAWLGNLGLAYHYSGELRVAIAYHAQHLELAQKIGDTVGIVNALTNIGMASFGLLDYPTARQSYEAALALAQEHGDERGVALSLGHLGPVYLALGEVERAEESLRQGISAAQALGDRRLEAATLGDLGNLHYEQGDAAAALALYQQQLAIVRELGNRRAEAIAHSNLGNAALALGDATQAEHSYRTALERALEAGEQRVTAIVGWNLALRLEQRGALAAAAELFQRCVDYERSVGHPDAEADATYLEQLRARIIIGDPEMSPRSVPPASKGCSSTVRPIGYGDHDEAEPA